MTSRRDRLRSAASAPALQPERNPIVRRGPHWRPPAALRAVFLGDWHPVLRDPLDLLRLSFVVGAVVFAVSGDGHASTQLALTAVAVFLARMVGLPRLFDWGFCVAMFFNGWGDALHLFVDWSWYDNVVHLILPCFLAPIVYIGLSRVDVVPEPALVRLRASRLLGMGVIAFCIGVTGVTIYEVYEWIAVRWLDQNLFISYADTIADISDGFAGSLAGALLLCLWSLGRFSSRRTPRDWRGNPIEE
ncbi:hypothetical protein [Conexibacter sp. CPCC 206217]|uniref:hypothetical protein n=1 Tax=Conexibacter sp. CPCC 206217 TaxID=3064574 RepID=UPI00271A703D|nr:hypothetical protein [Conexibacter sp. CPCC 206217]MDO8212763.1 hypothetical protein [Conexibacter sp. CPCC 206217]